MRRERRFLEEELEELEVLMGEASCEKVLEEEEEGEDAVKKESSWNLDLYGHPAHHLSIWLQKLK